MPETPSAHRDMAGCWQMSLFKRYIHQIIQWIVVIFVGTTVFLVPAITHGPCTTLSSMSSLGMANPEAIRQMEEVLMDLYGLREPCFNSTFGFGANFQRGSGTLLPFLHR